MVFQNTSRHTPGVLEHFPTYTGCSRTIPSIYRVSQNTSLHTQGVLEHFPSYTWCSRTIPSIYRVSQKNSLHIKCVLEHFPPYTWCPRTLHPYTRCLVHFPPYTGCPRTLPAIVRVFCTLPAKYKVSQNTFSHSQGVQEHFPPYTGCSRTLPPYIRCLVHFPPYTACPRTLPAIVRVSCTLPAIHRVSKNTSRHSQGVLYTSRQIQRVLEHFLPYTLHSVLVHFSPYNTQRHLCPRTYYTPCTFYIVQGVQKNSRQFLTQTDLVVKCKSLFLTRFCICFKQNPGELRAFY